MIDDYEELSKENQHYISDCIRAGRPVEQVINKALDMLRAAEGPVVTPPERMEWLRREIQQGLDEIDRGQVRELDVEAFNAEMRAKHLKEKKRA